MGAANNNSIFIEGLGSISIHRNARAKRFVFRVRQNKLQMTAPKYSSEKEIYQAASSIYMKLKSLLEESKTPLIDLSFKIKTDYFEFEMVEGDRTSFYSHSELGKLLVVAPKGRSFEDEDLQKWLHKVIVEALRRNAKIILPPMLYRLARKHAIPYQQVKINTSKGRWGSCSGKKNINLSAYLVLLPTHLIEYVLLHELAHIKEMNHSSRFWAYLDTLTDGQAKALDQELKSFHTSIFISPQA